VSAVGEATPVAAVAPAVDGLAAAWATAETGVTAAAEPTPSRTIEQTLLGLVAERTGYASEMLDLDANLEADLGVDSIKRVEILAAFQKACFPETGGNGRNLLDRLSAVKSLRHILEVAKEGLGDGRNEPASAERSPSRDRLPPPANFENHNLPRLKLVLHDAPCAPQPLNGDGLLIVTDDEAGVADVVLDRLRAAGVRAVRVRMSDALVQSPDSYAANLTDPEQVRALVRSIRAQAGTVAGIVHLLPLKPAEDVIRADLATFSRRCAADVKSLFYFGRELRDDLCAIQNGRAGGILAATQTLSEDVDTVQRFNPAAGGVAGLIRTLAVELGRVRCRAVDLDAAATRVDIACRVLTELASVDSYPVVCYRGSRRMALAPEPAPLCGGDEVPGPLDANSVVLITGGARGITAEITATLARRYRPHLVIVGRSPLPPAEESPATVGISSAKALKMALMEQLRDQGASPSLAQVEASYKDLLLARAIRASLRQFSSAGARVVYRQADVRDEERFSSLIRELYSVHGRLDGVIHGAGIIEDKLCDAKSAESFDRVFDTKANSAFVLARELRPETLKFLAFFSSVAGAFGSRGQCDYTAANGVLNAFASYLDARWPARVVAVNWGPWEGIGMVSPEVQRQFEDRGIRLVSRLAGCHGFDDEIRRGLKGEAEVILGWGPWLPQPANAALPPSALQASL
jgi:NAD(P)-dependent dehydrogenase (short-subunit alcohol dehydrogenase family)